MAGLIGIALFIATRDLPTDELAKPQISVEFPAIAEAGSRQKAVFTITNPGPDMRSLFLAFARVGPSQGGQAIPAPLVDAGSGHENPAIVSIEPEPTATSPDAVVFRFGPLASGASTTITFEFELPDQTGPVANSVTAYTGEDPAGRATGIRLETQVGG